MITVYGWSTLRTVHWAHESLFPYDSTSTHQEMQICWKTVMTWHRLHWLFVCYEFCLGSIQVADHLELAVVRPLQDTTSDRFQSFEQITLQYRTTGFACPWEQSPPLLASMKKQKNKHVVCMIYIFKNDDTQNKWFVQLLMIRIVFTINDICFLF